MKTEYQEHHVVTSQKERKKINTLYWIFTALFSASMLFTAIPDVLQVPDAVKFMHEHLLYPLYFTPFLGVAKVLGSIAILLPINKLIGVPIKEWAYAGLAFDLIGAIYSNTCVDGFQPQMLLMLIWVGLGMAAYYFYHKKLKEHNF